VCVPSVQPLHSYTSCDVREVELHIQPGMIVCWAGAGRRYACQASRSVVTQWVCYQGASVEPRPVGRLH
jgi:hypothetical protein